MEDGLVLSSPRMPPNRGNVLILVVMEDGLVPRTVVMNTVDEFES